MTITKMLKNRILSTLNFFDLQDYPLTLLELHRFLIADAESLKQKIDVEGEIISLNGQDAGVGIDEVLRCLITEVLEAENTLGFYHLKGRSQIAKNRLNNYFFGFKRERLIKKYIFFLKYLPFVRGVALGGSQALGLAKPTSDIDLFIVTKRGFMWLARTVVTVYFQILGKRRYGQKIANRFCLNHYVAGPKTLDQIKNLYSAMEYGRLRPLLGVKLISAFQLNNQSWIKVCFPNWRPVTAVSESQPKIQLFLEKLLSGRIGKTLEQLLKNWQEPRIKKGQFIIVQDDELSFHPDSKQEFLLQKFFFN